MTSLPPNADELVSAYLDGEAAPDEIAIVEASPELLAQVESLRAVSTELGAIPAPPSAQKEAHLSAALDAFDAMFATDTNVDSVDGAETDATSTASSNGSHLAAVASSAPGDEAAATAAADGSNVSSLGEARERRRRRFSPGLIAAAMVAMALLVVAAFGLSGGGSRDDVAGGLSDADLATVPATTAASEAPEAMDDAAMDDEEPFGGVQFERSQAVIPPAADSAPSPTVVQLEDFAAATAEEAAMAEVEGRSFAYIVTDGSPVYGEFDSIDLLLEELLPSDDINPLLVEELDLINATGAVFVNCQRDVPNLAASELTTYAGLALVDGAEIEIHVLVEDEFSSLYVVERANGCEVLQIVQTQEF